MTAVCPNAGSATSISVKALKSSNAFLIDPESLLPDSIYVFVITGPAGQQPRFHIIRGSALLADEKRVFGKYGRAYKTKHGRGIGHKALAPYLNKWAVLESNEAIPPKGRP